MKAETIQKVIVVSQMIKSDGIEAMGTARNMVGAKTARYLLIAHLSHNMSGSAIIEVLKAHKLM